MCIDYKLAKTEKKVWLFKCYKNQIKKQNLILIVDLFKIELEK